MLKIKVLDGKTKFRENWIGQGSISRRYERMFLDLGVGQITDKLLTNFEKLWKNIVRKMKIRPFYIKFVNKSHNTID